MSAPRNASELNAWIDSTFRVHAGTRKMNYGWDPAEQSVCSECPPIHFYRVIGAGIPDDLCREHSAEQLEEALTRAIHSRLESLRERILSQSDRYLVLDVKTKKIPLVLRRALDFNIKPEWSSASIRIGFPALFNQDWRCDLDTPDGYPHSRIDMDGRLLAAAKPDETVHVITSAQRMGGRAVR